MVEKYIYMHPYIVGAVSSVIIFAVVMSLFRLITIWLKQDTKTSPTIGYWPYLSALVAIIVAVGMSAYGVRQIGQQFAMTYQREHTTKIVGTFDSSKAQVMGTTAAVVKTADGKIVIKSVPNTEGIVDGEAVQLTTVKFMRHDGSVHSVTTIKSLERWPYY